MQGRKESDWLSGDFLVARAQVLFPENEMNVLARIQLSSEPT
jgi:hypothetical protein